MQLRLCLGLVGLLVALLRPGAASALQFQQIPTSPTAEMIGGRGTIVPGDTARLEQALQALPPGREFIGLALDSPGGSVGEGASLARLIHARGLLVLVPSDAKCVSACFLLLAASPHRLVGADALIGVHSASQEGEETGASLAVTTLMARVAAEMGVPPAIIGKMVETVPGRVEWLTHADLISMGVTVIESDASGPPGTAAAGPPVTATPAPAPAPANPAPRSGPSWAPQGIPPAAPHAVPTVAPQAVPSLAPQTVEPMAPQGVPPMAPQGFPPAAPQPLVLSGFAAGRDDRRVWDLWFQALRGAYRDGAAFARDQLGAAQAASCYGPGETNLGDFTLGCLVARRRLASVALRLGADREYVAGWRSMDAGPPPPPLGSGLAEAEYRGAFFCGQQIARLTLRLFPPAATGVRRGLFSFGPLPTSPAVPHGAFIVEGTVALDGGVLSLTPVEWVLQPAGYTWVGLSGRSSDGGRTFSGQVLDSTYRCSTFTLQRSRAVSASN